MRRISPTSLASAVGGQRVPGRRWRSRRSRPTWSPRPPCRRLLPESLRPSGHRHSGSGSRCRGLLDPEGDGSFEYITLHPQPGVVALQLSQAGALVAGQALALATVDAVLLDPVPQGRVVDAQLTGDLSDRPVAGAHQLHGVTLELGGELPSGPVLLVGHLASLLSSEVSCHRGNSKTPPPQPRVWLVGGGSRLTQPTGSGQPDRDRRRSQTLPGLAGEAECRR